MKKIFLALAISTLAFNAYSGNTTYNTKTGVVHIPVVDIDGSPALSDVELKIRADGLLEVVSFKKYAQSGGVVEGECATYNGLMWEVKTDDFGLRDRDNKYIWYDPTLSQNWDGSTDWAGVPDDETDPWGKTVSGSCSGGIQCDTYHYTNAVNARNLCGYNDWRMPTMDELKTLIVEGNQPKINNTLFPNTQPYFPGYWSSTSGGFALNTGTAAQYLSFDKSDFSAYTKTGQRYVRLVRSL